MSRKQSLSYVVIALLAVAALALFSANAHGQTPDPRQDTTYTVSPDQPNVTYAHYYRLTRGDSVMGFVLNGADTPYAGSCRNVWCALVPTAPNVIAQSGGTFSSFNDAAHEVVRYWNVAHLSTFVPPVTPVPVDTVPTPVPPQPTVDSSYTTTRVACPAGKWLTCYNIRRSGELAGWVWQRDTSASRRWVPGRGSSQLPGPYETTLRAAALRVALSFTPSPSIDTIHKTVYVFDTVRTTVTMPPDTVWNHIPITVYDTTHVPVVIKDSTPVAFNEPELPRHMEEMDAMLASARASDTVTRQYMDLVGKQLVARTDSLGRYVCGNIVQFDSAGKRWEKPQTFPCTPEWMAAAVKARALQAQQQREMSARRATQKELPKHEPNRR